MQREQRIPIAVITIGLLIGLGASMIVWSLLQPSAQAGRVIDLDSFINSSNPDETAAAGAAPATKRYSTHINRPEGPPRVRIASSTPGGADQFLSCSSCHSIREPNLTNRTPADLHDFHTELAFAHGSVSCLSCHNPDDYDSLRLADGTRVEYTEVMTLCAQCHGPQARDYERGAHGGMNGYWDLSRGSRTRNNCVDCHDPHVPAFPKMKPTFKPRDRFLAPSHDSHHAGDDAHE